MSYRPILEGYARMFGGRRRLKLLEVDLKNPKGKKPKFKQVKPKEEPVLFQRRRLLLEKLKAWVDEKKDPGAKEVTTMLRSLSRVEKTIMAYANEHSWNESDVFALIPKECLR